jgi:hypothetical protein
MSQINVLVDPGNTFGRSLTELERKQLPFATMQAINQTAFAVHQRWAEVMPRIFDRPTSLTLKAVKYDKATKQNLSATVKVRDEIGKGTPPAKYLLSQVQGGSRVTKGLERDLQRRGILAAGGFVVPGQGAQLDAYGNLPRAQINAIKSQLGAFGEQGYSANETDVSRSRRQKRLAKAGKRGGNYFAVPSGARGRLAPGVYERLSTGFGSAVRSVLHFVRAVRYRRRYDIHGMAQTIFDRRFPSIFEAELAKAVASAFNKAFR